MRDTDRAFFPSEPYPFEHRHLEELRAGADCSNKRLALIDGAMVGWYGCRASKWLAHLRHLERALTPHH